jgi:hypothetical protein
MNPPATTRPDDPQAALSPEAAWELWHQLNHLAESLWDAYEQEFLRFCILDAENQNRAPSPYLVSPVEPFD